MFTFFRKLGPFLKSALHIVGNAATDDLVKMAFNWVTVASEDPGFRTNDARREFVVKMLMGRGVSESVARLVTELAVQLLKQQHKETSAFEGITK